MEVFSEDGHCPRTISNVPPFAAAGQMVSLLDNKLQLVGFSENEKMWVSSSMEDPFGGIWANPWSQRITSSDSEASGYDLIYVHFSDIFLSGGHPKKQAQLKTEEWVQLNERSFVHEKSTFSNFTSAACKVYLDNNKLMLIGGISFDTNLPVDTVMTVNAANQTVLLHKSLLYPRCHHSCEVLSKTFLLISGGFSDPKNPGSSIVADEIYNMETGESQDVIRSLGRYDHRLIRLQDSIFALGGQVASGSPVSAVEKFESSSRSWSRHPEDLLSTGRLAVTAFPVSALDCQDCSCGVKKSARILQGGEAEVCTVFIFQEQLVMLKFCRKDPIHG